MIGSETRRGDPNPNEEMLSGAELSESVGKLMADFEQALKQLPEFLAGLAGRGYSVEEYFSVRQKKGRSRVVFNRGRDQYNVTFLNKPDFRHLSIGRHFSYGEHDSGVEYVVCSVSGEGFSSGAVSYGKEFTSKRPSDIHHHTRTAIAKAGAFLSNLSS